MTLDPLVQLGHKEILVLLVMLELLVPLVVKEPQVNQDQLDNQGQWGT